MKTDQLIESLSAKNTKVEELPPPLIRLFKWCLGAAICMAIGIAFLGLRHDLNFVFGRADFVIQVVFTVFLAFSSALSAFFLSIPDQERRWIHLVPALCLVSWALGIAYGMIGLDSVRWSLGFTCIRDIAVLAVLPGALLFLMIRNAAPLKIGRIGAFAALSVSALGALGTQFVCSNDDPFHILLWHYVPVLGIGWLGIVLGKWFLKW